MLILLRNKRIYKALGYPGVFDFDEILHIVKVLTAHLYKKGEKMEENGRKREHSRDILKSNFDPKSHIA